MGRMRRKMALVEKEQEAKTGQQASQLRWFLTKAIAGDSRYDR
jgi:hypothetical protein